MRRIRVAPVYPTHGLAITMLARSAYNHSEFSALPPGEFSLQWLTLSHHPNNPRYLGLPATQACALAVKRCRNRDADCIAPSGVREGSTEREDGRGIPSAETPCPS